MTEGPRRPRVALITSKDWPSLAPDDAAIAPALARQGVEAEVAVWTDGAVRWEGFDLLVIRSCWDYHDDLARWLTWVDDVEARCGPGRLENSPALLRWNARKTYLTNLQAAGVPTVPTRWLAGADLASERAFRNALRATGWDDLVVKPAVSAGALCTHRWRRIDAVPGSAFEAALPALALRGPVMVQSYLPEIEEAGEWSLLFFAGAFSHAVCKRPAAGDFRVQEKHGGTFIGGMPSPTLLRAAQHVLFVAATITARPPDPALLYARVDLIVQAGTPLLMELEITEPALFLGCRPSGRGETPVDRFARAIAARARATREVTR